MKEAIYISVYADFKTRYFIDATVALIKELNNTEAGHIKHHKVFNDIKMLFKQPPVKENNYHVLITDNVKVGFNEWPKFKKLKAQKIFSHFMVFVNKQDPYSIYKWVYEMKPDAVISCDDGKDRLKSALEAMCFYNRKPHSSSVRETAERVKYGLPKNIEGHDCLFTARDIQILQMYVDDYATSEIIRELNLSNSGFHKIKSRLHQQLGVEKVAALTAKAVQLGIVQPQ